MEELNKLIIYDLKDVTVQQIKKVNRIQVCFWELIDYLINRAMNVEEKWRLILLTSNGILGHCVGQNTNSYWRFSHIFHLTGETKSGNTRFHAVIQLDLHNLDQNILSTH